MTEQKKVSDSFSQYKFIVRHEVKVLEEVISKLHGIIAKYDREVRELKEAIKIPR